MYTKQKLILQIPTMTFSKHDRHVCMVINVHAPVILVGSVFLNKFYIKIRSFTCIIYKFQLMFSCSTTDLFAQKPEVYILLLLRCCFPCLDIQFAFRVSSLCKMQSENRSSPSDSKYSLLLSNKSYFFTFPCRFCNIQVHFI